jgi:DNA invertase Pin-like site-specific DNA recombinase
MAVYAYFRVSTEQQDVDNQRYGVLVYANARGLGPLQFVEDTASGRLAWCERAVGRWLTATTQAGDVALFAEVSHIPRSTLQVLEMLACCMQRGMHVHITKQQMVLDGSLPSHITATVLGLAAVIEREFMTQRTREALAKRRAEGKPPTLPGRSTPPRSCGDAVRRLVPSGEKPWG